ncbi:MAG: hypothetical protein CMF49_03535 [Legionellales bacterium]|nr:hypothetical protein [Legionellales bacterium]
MDDALKAFQSASGLSPTWIITMASATLILSALLIYGVCLLVTLKQSGQLEFQDIVMAVLRTIFMLGLIIACFAI